MGREFEMGRRGIGAAHKKLHGTRRELFLLVQGRKSLFWHFERARANRASSSSTTSEVRPPCQGIYNPPAAREKGADADEVWPADIVVSPVGLRITSAWSRVAWCPVRYLSLSLSPRGRLLPLFFKPFLRCRLWWWIRLQVRCSIMWGLSGMAWHHVCMACQTRRNASPRLRSAAGGRTPLHEAGGYLLRLPTTQYLVRRAGY